MSVNRLGGVRLPNIPNNADPLLRQMVLAVRDVLVDHDKRQWAIESALGMAPRKAVKDVVIGRDVYATGATVETASHSPRIGVSDDSTSVGLGSYTRWRPWIDAKLTADIPTNGAGTIAPAKGLIRMDIVTDRAPGTEPAPSAPTVALAGAGAGNVDNGTHYYKVTFVTSAGQTEGGTASSVVTVVDKTVNGKVALSAIPTGRTLLPAGANAVTSRKIYRTVAGGAVDSTYKLVGTISDNTTTTYTDNIADASLGATMPSTNTTWSANDSETTSGIAINIATQKDSGSESSGMVITSLGNGNALSLFRIPSTSLSGYGGPSGWALRDAVSRNYGVCLELATEGNTIGAAMAAIDNGIALNVLVGDDATGGQYAEGIRIQPFSRPLVTPEVNLNLRYALLVRKTHNDVTTVGDADDAFRVMLDGGTVIGNGTHKGAGTLNVVGGIWGALNGTTTNDSAASGVVGEVISSTVVAGSAVSITSVTGADLTSISLTAGEWDVWFDCIYLPTGTTTVTLLEASINNTTGTRSTTPGEFGSVSYPASVLGSFNNVVKVGPVRKQLASTTTIYGTTYTSFATSTLQAFGKLWARRVR